MIELSDQQIMTWLGGFLWPLFRVMGFFMVVPIIGAQMVPMRVRLALAVMVTWVLLPVLAQPPYVDPLSLANVLLIAQQLLIGVALGFIVQVVFQVFVLIGQIIAMQMGLGFASMLDPANGVNVAVVSQLYLLLVNLLFLSMNGHLALIDTLAESFRIIPVGQWGLSAERAYHIAQTGVWMFSAALLVALPAVAALLIVNMAFGIMTRAAPQMNIFSLGFPFTLLFGLLIIWGSLSGFVPQFERITAEGFTLLRSWMGVS